MLSPVIDVGVTLLDAFGIFGEIDQGHWEGNKFIPGDLQSRFNVADSYLRQYGLSSTDISYSKIYDILTTPGIWQNNIHAYYKDVKKQIDAGTYINPNFPPSIGGGNGVVTTTTQPQNTSYQVAGINPLLLIGVAGAAFFLLKGR